MFYVSGLRVTRYDSFRLRSSKFLIKPIDGFTANYLRNLSKTSSLSKASNHDAKQQPKDLIPQAKPTILFGAADETF